MPANYADGAIKSAARAYGVKRNEDGTWLHYWIDLGLGYNERASESPTSLLGITFDSRITVTLRGPGDFIVHAK